MTRGSPQHTKKVFEKEKIRSFNRKKLQKKVCNVINRWSYNKKQNFFLYYFYNFLANIFTIFISIVHHCV